MGQDTYAEALADHHRLIRTSLSHHDGKEIATQGDGFFAVFSSPSAGVAAVIEMQLALGAHVWPTGEQVRVRMGVHCGEASESVTGLVGIEVHRAARIGAVAHGGQVVVSETAAALVRNSLPAGALLRDLGRHRLKDLGQPEQIFQLQADGLETNFPPLKSLDNPELANNLPSYLSAFIGRETELAEVRSLVQSSRLVTLTGAGGSGKTRLALQLGAELLDGSGEGVFFVDLAVIAESDQVPGAVRASLGIREQAGRPPLELLVEVLRDQRVLIVLDNCEHVVDACAKLADLVERSCPKVHLVVTSREPLGIDGERVYRVRPLSLPSEEATSVGDLDGSDAVELFVERAGAHGDIFVLEDSIAPVVASICRRLDGIPFAIELAAARLGTMSLGHLNERLDQRFRLLTGGSRTALARQRTLQAMVDWSFELLNEHEREVLRRLSVFVGGFELEAAEAVCATETVSPFDVADLLGALVNKSLVVAERSSGAIRYRLLETIRQYAADQLVAAGGTIEAVEARRAHAEYYLQLCETAAPELMGRRQSLWLKRLDLEWDNVRATLAHLYAEPERTEEVLRLGVALFRFFSTRRHREPIAQLLAALEQEGPVPAALRARALFVTGYLVASLLGFEDRLEMHAGGEICERALEMARELDDRPLVAETLGGLCTIVAFEGETSRATLLGEEAVELARSLGDPRLLGWTLSRLAVVAPSRDAKRALRLEALACARQARDILLVSTQLQSVGIEEAFVDERLEAARAHFEEALAAAEEIGSDWNLADLWSYLGWVLALQGEFEEAAPWKRRSLIAHRRFGRRSGAADSIFVLACCAADAGDHRRATQLTGFHDVIDADVIAAAPSLAYVWSPIEQRLRDGNRARLRQVLGEEEFERVYRLGRDLSFDEAVDLALGRDR